MPSTSLDSTKITRSAKVALPLMRDNNIPLTPENYRVWFEYASGASKELTSDIETRIKFGESFDDNVNAYLYEKHFGPAKDREVMEQVNQETQRILKGIFSQLITTNEFTSTYGDKLQRYADELNQAHEVSQIQNTIAEIIKDTTNMTESSHHLQDELKTATAQAETLRKRLVETQKEALTDALTGLCNRKALERRLDELHGEFQKSQTPYSIIMLDIDHFKHFNDKYGHPIGDGVLRQVAMMLAGSVRRVDFPARYGGEEFIVLLPDTVLNNARIIAEKIRQRIGREKLKVVKTGEGLGEITVSIGVAEANADDTVASTVERSDNALYLAKSSGRDNVKSERDLGKDSVSLPQ